MGRGILVIKLLVFIYLGYLVYFFLTTDGPATPGYNPPFAIFVLDTINLFIHEAGHLFLKIFGRFIYMIGGSFFQCFVPFALLVVTWRQNITQIAYPGFWLGENLVNVSAYIKDAPYLKLKLISKGAIHDWNSLLAGRTELGPPIGEVVYWIGVLVCLASVGVGIFHAVQLYREDAGFSSE